MSGAQEPALASPFPFSSRLHVVSWKSHRPTIATVIKSDDPTIAIDGLELADDLLGRLGEAEPGETHVRRERGAGIEANEVLVRGERISLA